LNNYIPPANILSKRVILVTGAGDGIGRATAKAFAEYGATVILLGRTIPKLESIYDEIEQAGYPQPAIYPMNLEGAVPKDYNDLANIITESFGKLDGLLHNAAILGTLTPIELYNTEQWYKVMQVNLNAPFMLTQACLPLLKKSDDASIVFTNDNVGEQGRAYWGAYGVSKAGTNNLMQILADELETNTNIRVNSINPNKVRTRLRSTVFPGEDQNTLPAPADIVANYIYLMSNDSKSINGQILST
jgi:NAD(P)-dependent dehydrogenase (short-subunit alcohol dehydrogenase family)